MTVHAAGIIILMILRHVFTIQHDLESIFTHNNNKGQLAAFGDFNSDTFIDIFILTEHGQSVEIVFGSDEGTFMRPDKRINCTFDGRHITSVVPGDFNGDALMDVLVTVQNIKEYNEGSTENDVYVLWGDLSCLQCPDKNQLPKCTVVDQPLVIDYNGDMIMDLFGVKKLQNDGTQNTFWLFNSHGNVTEQPMKNTENGAKMRIPQSHGYVDVKGDIAPDLYLTTDRGYEVWVSEAGSFHYVGDIPKPCGDASCIVGQSVFIDTQLQGHLDNVVPVCLDADCAHSAIYFHDSTDWYDLNVHFKDGLRFVPPTRSRSPYLETITLRPGDFNLDGYTDLLATVCGRDCAETKVVLLENVPCTDCRGFDRHFAIDQKIFDSVNGGNNYVMGAFYDFFQNGVLDVLLISRVGDGGGQTTEYEMTAVQNGLDVDSNFLKVMVITALANHVSQSLGKKSRMFGTNLPGPKVVYETNSYRGDNRKGVATQLPQSAHFSLHLPYTIFGLGRYCNFIAKLNVSVLNETYESGSIIPNSQIVVVPSPLHTPTSWQVKLFVTPSRIILQSAIAFAGTCLLLLITIGVLHYRERKLDHIKFWEEDGGAISVFR